jgi:hypothetical protein
MRIPLPRHARFVLRRGIPISLKFAVTARIRGHWKLADLEGALERLARRHPALGSRIESDDASGSTYFTTEGVRPIGVRVLERASDEDWARAIEREVPRPFDYRTGPLYDCVWIRGEEVSDLVLISEHMGSDGRAGLNALRDLARFLADPSLELDPVPPPPLAGLLPQAVAVRVRELVARVRAQAEEPEGGPRQAFPPSGRGAEPSLRVLPFALEAGETAGLVDRCRAEGTTVQGALCAAFAAPFAEREGAESARFVEVPIDLRPRLARPVDEACANYISLLRTRLDLPQGRELWAAARDASEDLAGADDDRVYGTQAVLRSLVDEPLPPWPVAMDYDVSISNLGRLDLPERYGDLVLESVYAPTFNASRPGHRVLGVSTFAGRMRCTFASSDPEAPQLLARARALLDAMRLGAPRVGTA